MAHFRVTKHHLRLIDAVDDRDGPQTAAALAIFTLLGVEAAERETDGLLDPKTVTRLLCTWDPYLVRAALKSLDTVRLIELVQDRVDGPVQVCWTGQPTAAQRTSTLAKQAARQKRYRERDADLELRNATRDVTGSSKRVVTGAEMIDKWINSTRHVTTVHDALRDALRDDYDGARVAQTIDIAADDQSEQESASEPGTPLALKSCLNLSADPNEERRITLAAEPPGPGAEAPGTRLNVIPQNSRAQERTKGPEKAATKGARKPREATPLAQARERVVAVWNELWSASGRETTFVPNTSTQGLLTTATQAHLGADQTLNEPVLRRSMQNYLSDPWPAEHGGHHFAGWARSYDRYASRAAEAEKRQEPNPETFTREYENDW